MCIISSCAKVRVGLGVKVCIILSLGEHSITPFSAATPTNMPGKRHPSWNISFSQQTQFFFFFNHYQHHHRHYQLVDGNGRLGRKCCHFTLCFFQHDHYDHLNHHDHQDHNDHHEHHCHHDNHPHHLLVAQWWMVAGTCDGNGTSGADFHHSKVHLPTWIFSIFSIFLLYLFHNLFINCIVKKLHFIFCLQLYFIKTSENHFFHQC